MDKYHKHINYLKQKQIGKFLYASNQAQPETALDIIPVVDKNNIYLSLKSPKQTPYKSMQYS